LFLQNRAYYPIQFGKHAAALRAARKLADQSPDILISNTVALDDGSTVYLGDDDPALCASAEKFVEAPKGNSVFYCFNVTNTGYTHLNNITVTDTDLSFERTYPDMLAPGDSVLLVLPNTLSGNSTNLALVTATPVLPDGSDFTALGSDLTAMNDVSHSDTSAVGEVGVGDKVPYSAPGDPTANNCLQDSWMDAGNGDHLICTTKEVFLVAESITSESMSCILGDMIKVTVKAAISVESTRNDLGWYVAADDGDALEGTCVVNGLQHSYEYQVMDGPGGTNEAGLVSWSEDTTGGMDTCGDVLIVQENISGFIDVPFVVNTPLRCSDDNGDGRMDMTVCFTWRMQDADEFCTLTDSDPFTSGRLADLYPGSNSMCYCETYDIPTIAVVMRDAPVAPCR
jgi:hypothetical protein